MYQKKLIILLMLLFLTITSNFNAFNYIISISYTISDSFIIKINFFTCSVNFTLPFLFV